MQWVVTSSLDWEGAVLVEFSLDLVLRDVEQSAATTGAAISVDCQGDALLQEFLDLDPRHRFLVVGIKVTLNEDTT